jgi:hypothetical protein
LIRIIVLTPVKNESWILEKFLSVTSFFADNIIIADQNSNDSSRRICAKFDKVILISNDSIDFNEADRQALLIETARKLFPNDKRILFCLDADEIISFNAIDNNNFWHKIRNLNEGDAIYIEKPDLLKGLNECVRWKNNYFPIGFVDDGRKHNPSQIHSMRIPNHCVSEKKYFDDVKILHLAHSRQNVQSSKLRYYSVIENIKKTKPVYLRRFAYPCFYDGWKVYSKESIEIIPSMWLENWKQKGIDFSNLNDPEISWHDLDVLSIFIQYGIKRFYLENIWEVDWEKVRMFAIMNNFPAPKKSIKKPGIVYIFMGKLIDFSYLCYRRLRSFNYK